jgi:hypothetical protein
VDRVFNHAAGTEMSRPSAYRKYHAELAQNYALLGATDEEIANFLGVTDRTLRTWKKAHPAFAEALNHGKMHADARMIGAAFRNGLAGNATIQIFWLKNRLGWRDKTEVTGANGGPVQLVLQGSDVHG